MKTFLHKYWTDLVNSYWFVPTLMAATAIGLSYGMIVVDTNVDIAWASAFDWAYRNTADGARTLLSTVAGSMLGVAGVTFSITIVSVVYASGQYGPRLLTSFMADRGNQFTLGTFIATFLYCLLVLRTVQPEQGSTAAFVPHLSILLAVVLSVCSIGVLIYFIHHVPQSIHVSSVVSGVGHELMRKVDHLFPDPRHATPRADSREAVDARTGATDRTLAVDSALSGYLQAIDLEGLIAAAREMDAVVRVVRRPGDFAAVGDVIARVIGRKASPSEDGSERVRSHFVIGHQRNALQDSRFLVRQLMETAARALSPSLNDPRTAMDCMDWMGAVLKRLSEREMPGSDLSDESGDLRVVVDPATFGEFVEEFFGQLRSYAAADPNAARHAIDVLGEVMARAQTENDRATLRDTATSIASVAEQSLSASVEIDSIRERLRSKIGETATPSTGAVG